MRSQTPAESPDAVEIVCFCGGRPAAGRGERRARMQYVGDWPRLISTAVFAALSSVNCFKNPNQRRTLTKTHEAPHSCIIKRPNQTLAGACLSVTPLSPPDPPVRARGASAAALAAGRTRSVVKGYCCAAVSFCIRRRVFACAAVSGVRLANTLSPRCGYYAHIQSIWHNHHSHFRLYLSLGNSSWSVRACARVIEI